MLLAERTAARRGCGDSSVSLGRRAWLCVQQGCYPPDARLGASAARQPGEGVALIRQGLAGMAETGVRAAVTDMLSRLAEAQALDSKIDDALVSIEEALQANAEALVYRPS